MRELHVYILASRTRRLYVGVTNDLRRRVAEHRAGLGVHTSRYRITRLVHFESFPAPMAAIRREKQLKGWLRRRKLALVSESNPEWMDLSEGWELPDVRVAIPRQQRCT